MNIRMSAILICTLVVQLYARELMCAARKQAPVERAEAPVTLSFLRGMTPEEYEHERIKRKMKAWIRYCDGNERAAKKRYEEFRAKYVIT